METKIINKDELGRYLEQLPHHPVVGMLFTGDRISCIGFAVVIEYGDKLAGLATVAPNGEGMGSDKPTIVGVFVMEEYRKQGYSRQLLESAIDACVERGLKPVHIEVMSGRLMKVINKLDAKHKEQLDIIDFGSTLDMWN